MELLRSGPATMVFGVQINVSGFTGFGERATEFYEGLEANNSKAYWADNREVYEEHVKAPMDALLAELAAEFGDGKVFRPYRDVRFSNDKTPYKTHCGAVVWTPGGSYYTHVSADGLLVAGGAHGMSGDQLARFRVAVDDQRRGSDLQRRLDELRAAGYTVDGDRLKTRPRGIDPEHPRLDLLRHRTLYAWRSWEPDDALHGPECAERVRESWRAMRPFNEWLADHVGSADPR